MILIRLPQMNEGFLAYAQARAEALQIALNQQAATVDFSELAEGELWEGERLQLPLPVQPLLRATRYQGEVYVEAIAWYTGDSEAEAFPENPEFPWRPPAPMPTADWAGLAERLFGSPLHLKLRTQAATNGECAIALTEIMSAINGHNAALLELGLKGAIAALGASDEERAIVQGWLDEGAIGVRV